MQAKRQGGQGGQSDRRTRAEGRPARPGSVPQIPLREGRGARPSPARQGRPSRRARAGRESRLCHGRFPPPRPLAVPLVPPAPGPLGPLGPLGSSPIRSTRRAARPWPPMAWPGPGNRWRGDRAVVQGAWPAGSRLVSPSAKERRPPPMGGGGRAAPPSPCHHTPAGTIQAWRMVVIAGPRWRGLHTRADHKELHAVVVVGFAN
jgi:hypothetical protein